MGEERGGSPVSCAGRESGRVRVREAKSKKKIEDAGPEMKI